MKQGRGGAAQVRLSNEAEKKLSKLVENVAQKSSDRAAGAAAAPTDRKQAERRLRKIYDDLGNEGFTTDQIELALSAIPLAECTLEAALDWLCLNLASNDLPLKFSSGYSVEDTAGDVQVLAAAEPGAAPVHQKPAEERQKEFEKLSRLDSKSTRAPEPKANKDWIRQYVAQQEEEEEESGSGSDLSDWEDRAEGPSYSFRLKGSDPADHAKQIAEAFVSARKAAAEAKTRGDKERQSESGKLIRELKEKMAALGLSEQDLMSNMVAEQMNPPENTPASDDEEVDSTEDLQQADDEEVPEKKSPTTDEAPEDEDGEMMGMFDEDSSADQSLPASVLKLQKKQEIKPWGSKGGGSGSNKKNSKVSKPAEELQKSPRAVLQQYCQKMGWNPPKYEKKPRTCSYTITIFRPGAGRGKKKIAGGQSSYALPENEEAFSSVSDAQDAAATWALFSLFPEEPLHLELVEPFRSMWLRWHDQGKGASEPDALGRDRFISSLFTSETSCKTPQVSEAPKLAKIDEYLSRSTEGPGKTLNLSSRKHDQDDHAASIRMQRMQERKLQDANYKKMLAARSLLPIASIKDTILDHLQTSDVLVVSGETGSGKTTQVPQYILDEMISKQQGGRCKIICTQPRRIAAISIAERVASERCEPAPGDSGSTVGYQVRLDASWSSETRLLFCTTGILLRKLAHDPELSDVTHVVVDEVHERTALGDFLISLLKVLLAKRNQTGSHPLKVILMSATLDAERFSQYFGGCPVVVAKGRTFPVETFYLEDIYEELSYRLSSDNPAAINSYTSRTKVDSRHKLDKNRRRQNLTASGWGDEKILEETLINPFYEESMYSSYSENTRKSLGKLNEDVIDYELLEDLVLHINRTGEAGALLVFLPGMPEILQLLDRLLVSKDFSGPASDWILPLHSSVAPGDQKKVFRVPPDGIRKIVLATNIAETSVTIEDVVHVIDCGKHKENRFDPRRRMSCMAEAWISQANAQQRKGRAGRVKAGNCFCLYTEHRFNKLMRAFQLPEMLRVPLVELCLQIKILSSENVALFLEKTLDPPKAEAVETAMSVLREVGALNEKEDITPLGHHLAALPVDVHIGKMMLYGVLLGCLDPALTIAAYLSHKSPFVAPVGKRDAGQRAKQAFSDPSSNTIASKQQSDHLVIVAAYNSWRRILANAGGRSARQFCDSNFLSFPVLNMLREMRLQFAKLLRDIGFITEVDRGAGADKWLDDPTRPFNRNSDCGAVIKSVLCAGLYPNLASMQEESVKAGHANALTQRAGLASEGKPRWSDGRREVFIHPSSINSKVIEFQHPYLVFFEKIETSKVFLRDTTVLSPFSVLLFGGSIKVQHQIGLVTVDGWMKMNVPGRTAVQLRELRSALDSLLHELTQSPQGLSSSKAKNVVASILQLLIEVEQ